MPFPRWRVLALLLLLLTPVPSGAPLADEPEFDFLPDQAGTVDVVVEPKPSYRRRFGAAGVAEFESRFGRFRDALVAQPVLRPPRGVRVTGFLRIDDPSADSSRAPIRGAGMVQYFPCYRDKKTGQPTFWKFTTDEISVNVNAPEADLDPYSGPDDVKTIYYEPERAGEVGGFPIFRMESGTELIVLSRNGRLPWTPYTREEFVSLWLRRWRKTAAESGGDKTSLQVVANHEAALAAMTGEERRAQARYQARNPLEPMLAPTGSRDGRALVKVDPHWYDPSLPRPAFQLITARFWYRGDLDLDHPGPAPVDGRISPLRLWETLHRSDWKAIGAVLAAK